MVADGKEPYLPGDVNHDGIVNSQDLALISSNWLATAGSGGAMALGFGQSAGSTTAVPEPGTYALCLIGAAMTFGWRACVAGLLPPSSIPAAAMRSVQLFWVLKRPGVCQAA